MTSVCVAAGAVGLPHGIVLWRQTCGLVCDCVCGLLRLGVVGARVDSPLSDARCHCQCDPFSICCRDWTISPTDYYEIPMNSGGLPFYNQCIIIWLHSIYYLNIHCQKQDIIKANFTSSRTL